MPTMSVRQWRRYNKALATFLGPRWSIEAAASNLGVDERIFRKQRHDGLEPGVAELRKLGIHENEWEALYDARAINEILCHVYPEDYPEDFKRAKKELWIFGSNLRRIAPGPHLGAFVPFLLNGGQLNVLLVNPECENACRYAALQEFDNTPQKFRGQIKTTLNHFCDIYKEVRKKSASAAEKLTIKRIDYPLTFGIDAMDPDDTEHGRIYVRFFPFQPPTDDQPILQLSAHRKEDRDWYEFYYEQIHKLWECKELITDWKCPEQEASTG